MHVPSAFFLGGSARVGQVVTKKSTYGHAFIGIGKILSIIVQTLRLTNFLLAVEDINVCFSKSPCQQLRYVY